MLGNLAFLSSVEFFRNLIFFSKIYFRNTIILLHSLTIWIQIRPDVKMSDLICFQKKACPGNLEHTIILFLAHLSHWLMPHGELLSSLDVLRVLSVVNNCFKGNLLLNNGMDFDQTWQE